MTKISLIGRWCAVLVFGCFVSMSRAGVLFERPLDNSVSGRFSNDIPSVNSVSFANSFALSENATVTEISWWGFFQSGALVNDFRVSIFGDNGAIPGELLYQVTATPSLEDTGLTNTLGGDVLTVWELGVDLSSDPLLLLAGNVAWIEIAHLAGTTSNQFIWSRALTSDGNIASRFNSVDPWTSLSSDRDAAFYFAHRVPEPPLAMLLLTGLVLLGRIGCPTFS